METKISILTEKVISNIILLTKNALLYKQYNVKI